MKKLKKVINRKTKKLKAKIKYITAQLLLVKSLLSPIIPIILNEVENGHLVTLPSKSVINNLQDHLDEVTKKTKISVPQIAILYDVKVDKITLQKAESMANEILILLKSGSISPDEAILRLRGGSGLGKGKILVLAILYVIYGLETGDQKVSKFIQKLLAEGFLNREQSRILKHYRERLEYEVEFEPRKSMFGSSRKQSPSSRRKIKLQLMEKPDNISWQQYKALDKVVKIYL